MTPAPGNPGTISTDPTKPIPGASKRRRTGCLVFVVILLVLLAATAFQVRRLYKKTPPHWTRNQEFLKTADQPTLLQLAINLEKRLPAETSDVGPDGSLEGNFNKPRKLHLSVDEVNAWLAIKLEMWASNLNLHLPPELSGYMVAIDGDNVVFSFQYETPRISQVVSIIVHPEMLADGRAKFQLVGIRAGELPLPSGLILGMLKNSLPNKGNEKDIEMVNAIMNGEPFAPVRPIDSTRQIRLLNFDLDASGADLTIQTERRTRR